MSTQTSPTSNRVETVMMNGNEFLECTMPVDRRMLEHMLQAPKYVVSSQHIFDFIAEKFGIATIAPEYGFSIGAKSRKTPNVIFRGYVGQADAINAAVEELATYFDTETNKVVAYVTIPAEKHYYVIGKEGCNVKPLMSKTGCHIHFPDTTRDGFSIKPIKNHVTITGLPDNVEVARVALRGYMPYILSFPVPEHIPTSETTMTPRIRALSRKYSLTIFFKQANNTRFMFFKGPRSNASKLEKAACEILVDWNVPNSSASNNPSSLSDYPDVILSAQFDVPCIYHRLLKADQALIRFAQQTQSRIDFHQEGVSSILYIEGNMETIKLIMSQLQCELPFSLSFELAEEASQEVLGVVNDTKKSMDKVVSDVVNENVEVSAQLDRTCVQVTIKGREGAVGAVYRARRDILNYFHQDNVNNYGFGSLDIDSPEIDYLVDDAKFYSPYHGARFSSLFGHPERMPSMRSRQNSEHNVASSDVTQSPFSNNGEARRKPFAEKNTPIGDYETRRRMAETVVSHPVEKEVRHPTDLFAGDFFSRSMSAAELKKGTPFISSMSDVSEEGEMGVPTKKTSTPRRGSKLSMETTQRPMSHQSARPNGHGAGNSFDFHQLPKEQHHLNRINDQEAMEEYSETDKEKFPILKRARDLNLNDSQDLLHEHSMGSLPPLNHSFSASSLASSLGAPVDQSGKNSATHISPHQDEFQSRISPFNLSSSHNADEIHANILGERQRQRQSSSTSNKHSDTTSTTPVASVFSPTASIDPEVAKYWDVKTVDDVLSKIGMARYTQVFEQEEIDLPVFLSLTESDLQDLGITTFGAKRKIKLACENIKKLFAAKGSDFLTHVYTYNKDED